MRSEQEIAEMLSNGEDPAKVGAGDKVFAGFYLASVLAVPIVVLCWAFELFGEREVYYAIPLFAAGAAPWLLVAELCDSYGRSEYSLLALRTQLWLHLGGAIPSALRTLRGTRTTAANS